MPEPLLYLDASAIVKLVLPEAESGALAEAVASTNAHVSSIIAAVEVPRAVRRVTEQAEALERSERVIERLDLRALDADVVRAAARLMPRALRSLDAIHLASAMTFAGDLSGFIAYDRRLRDAARESGVPVLAPGR